MHAQKSYVELADWQRMLNSNSCLVNNSNTKHALDEKAHANGTSFKIKIYLLDSA